MDINTAVDIFFLGMVVGACFAIAVLRKLRNNAQDTKEKPSSGTPRESS